MMALQNNEFFHSNVTYEIPDCYINNYFLFSSETGSLDEAELHFYDTYLQKSWYICWRGHFGCVNVNSPNKYLRLERGKAIYYGDKPFDLYEKLNTANFNDEHFHQSGITVMDNIVCKIEVMQRIKKPQLYHGDSIIEIFDQFIFCINDHVYWGGFIENHSFKNYSNIIVAIHDNASQKEYLFGEGGISRGCVFSVKDGPIKTFLTNKNDFFVIELPKEVSIDHISVSWLQLNNDSKKCFTITQSIDELYKEGYERLVEVILEYSNLGLELDAQKELVKFSNAPDFAEYCIEFLSEQLKQYPSFLQKALDKNKRFTFHVDASYDKAYYCAAKLADSSIDIKTNRDSTVYYITFDGTQIEEIDLMYYNLASPFNTDKDYMVEIFTYLKESLFFINLQSAINSYIRSLREQFGYSSVVTNSVLISIIKSIDKNRRKKLNKLYTEMIKENRVNVKWSSEYKLFDLISKYVDDAVYQYRAVWLGQQSFDIFLPSQNIAIEYQGLQHYEAVEIFGGQDALGYNIERDNRKRQISSEHGIIVLDWKYDIPVNADNVFSYLNENKIALTSRSVLNKNRNITDLSIDMAPIQAVDAPREREKISSQFVIKQYSTNGDFMADYWSYEEASQAAAVSKQQIQNAIRGSAKTAGGYQWRRVIFVDTDDNNLHMEPIKIENAAKAIYQMSSNGKVIAEYESIKKASKSVGVNSKSIRCVLNGAQNSAGGFLWVYKKN